MSVVIALKNEAIDRDPIGNVIAVDIAAAKSLSIVKKVAEVEMLPLMEASGRVLGRNHIAAMQLPAFDNSAMDGYAVQIGEFTGQGPWVFDIAGRIAAGEDTNVDFERGSAIRIFTGAPVPTGFNAVIMQEHCERSGDRVTIHVRPRRGENIRSAGEDVMIGAPILDGGDLLSSNKLALLAGMGTTTVEVLRKVRVGLISTGSELRDLSETLSHGQIFNSNRVMLRSLLSLHKWVEIVDFGIVPDRHHAVVEAIGAATRHCDILISTGGVSGGEEDHIVSALDEHGAQLDVLKVAMRPGKPLKIGLVGSMFFAGLPGNPNAALVTFLKIALPSLKKMAGLTSSDEEWLPAVAGFEYLKKLGRTEFVPVRKIGRDELGRPMLEMLGRGSSASLSAIAMADGIANLPPEATLINKGMPICFEPFGFN